MLLKLKNFLSRKPASHEKKGGYQTESLDLLVFDDCYPHPASGFRYEEFTQLLMAIPSSRIICTGQTYLAFGLTESDHQNHISDLESKFPDLKGKVEKKEQLPPVLAKLFYCVFLNNVYSQLEWIEKTETPFVFTLYPGGGFAPGDTTSDRKLRKVFNSPQFKAVIVTQEYTRRYLADNSFCSPEQIEFIFGVVVPQLSINNNAIEKRKYPSEKTSFDICFCAMKYTRLGEDKGYPLFVKLMEVIARKFAFVNFHIIGNFESNTINISGFENRVRFHGVVNYENMGTLFQQFDLIVSPNQPNMIQKGSFDGFPLGTVVEAVLNSVVAMVTDPYKENRYFTDLEDLIIITPEIDDLINKLESCLADPDFFYRIAENGRKKFREIYSSEYQLKPRIQLIQNRIESSTQTPIG